MVDFRTAVAEFRVASERRSDTTSEAYRFCKNLSNRSVVQRRHSIYSWKPGLRRGNEDAFEKNYRQLARQNFAGGLRMFRSRHSCKSVPRDSLRRMRGSLQGHFLPNINVKSIYLHDTRRDLLDRNMEGDQGWVMQSVLSRASFRRPSLSTIKLYIYVST